MTDSMHRIPEILRENSLTGIAIVGAAGEFIDVNDKFCQILGYEKSHLLKLTFQEITHPEDLAPDVNSYRRVIAGELPGYTMRKRYKAGDDRTEPVRATLLVKGYYNDDGSFAYFVSQIVEASDSGITETEDRQIKAIEDGLKHGQFELHYQPIVSAVSRETVAYEGLARWNHPQKGLVYPGDFLPLLKLAGKTHQLCHVVIQIAAQDQPKLGKKVAININPITIGLPDWESWATHINDGTYIEILESEPTSDFAQSRLQALRSRDIEIALDDFGTGYANYTRIGLVDILKIDASLVRGIDTDTTAFTRCASIVQLAHGMMSPEKPGGLKTVAEGVETQGQLEALKDMYCDYGQGYLFDKPMPLNHWIN